MNLSTLGRMSKYWLSSHPVILGPVWTFRRSNYWSEPFHFVELVKVRVKISFIEQQYVGAWTEQIFATNIALGQADFLRGWHTWEPYRMNDSDHYCRLKLELTKVQTGLKLKKIGHALIFLFFVHNFFQFLSTHETNFAHYSILNLPPSLLREKKTL